MPGKDTGSTCRCLYKALAYGIFWLAPLKRCSSVSDLISGLTNLVVVTGPGVHNVKLLVYNAHGQSKENGESCPTPLLRPSLRHIHVTGLLYLSFI